MYVSNCNPKAPHHQQINYDPNSANCTSILTRTPTLPPPPTPAPHTTPSRSKTHYNNPSHRGTHLPTSKQQPKPSSRAKE
ncbi:hypothetical protein L211DRAFT_841607 [Terfezia boudieri ATCC MYA-4762]|uniref:Uncharacterized protein n=1 Tax=Terfezia boudieri ATCC MYA-4762 TaxID=1051890 RepID=A0A3N4LCA0_9PEZI|nr:hypothetical protein L211DRAFT_841607 [Terfezia boudieri ATCC MYA-4762]